MEDNQLNSRKILIRTDADSNVGLGHIKRCISISKSLKKKGFQVKFLLRFVSIEVKGILKENFFDFFQISKKIKWSEEYLFLNSIVPNDFEFILFDFSHNRTLEAKRIFPQYFEQWNNSKILLIDGFQDQCLTSLYSLPLSLAVLPFKGSKNQEFLSKCEYLLGEKYFCLDESYKPYLKKKKKIKKIANSILITSGGNDLKGITLKAIRALNKLPKNNYFLRIVLGSMISSKSKNLILDELNICPHQYELYIGLDTLADKIYHSDLVISSSGLTKYECAALGIPAILISIDHAHLNYNKPFQKLESSIHLGLADEIEIDNLSKQIAILSSNYQKRLYMSKNGVQNIKGNGAKLIASHIANIH